MIAVPMGLIIGLLLPMQTAVNSRLRGFVGSPFVSSMISFFTGTVLLGGMMFLQHDSIFFSRNIVAGQPYWIWLGGFLGVVALTANILLFPHLGGVQTVILPMLGQIIMSMLIDNFGWFYSKQQSLTLLRVVGIVLVLAGVFLTVAFNDWFTKRRQIKQISQKKEKNIWFWNTVGIVAGLMISTQSAVNGRLGEVLNSPIRAAFISFFIGMLTLILLVAVLERNYKSVRLAIGTGKPWWLWTGGFLGAVFVLGNVYLVPIIGTGPTILLALLGQMIGSLLVDQFGLLGSAKKPISFVQTAGLMVLIAGIVLIKMY